MITDAQRELLYTIRRLESRRVQLQTIKNERYVEHRSAEAALGKAKASLESVERQLGTLNEQLPTVYAVLEERLGMSEPDIRRNLSALAQIEKEHATL